MTTPTPDVPEPIIAYKHVRDSTPSLRRAKVGLANFTTADIVTATNTNITADQPEYSNPEVYLHSAFDSQAVWVPGVTITARCHGRVSDWEFLDFDQNHTSPSELKDCPSGTGNGCGIYAYKFPPLQAVADPVRQDTDVIIEVELWGRVYEYEWGYRAQYARMRRVLDFESGDGQSYISKHHKAVEADSAYEVVPVAESQMILSQYDDVLLDFMKPYALPYINSGLFDRFPGFTREARNALGVWTRNNAAIAEQIQSLAERYEADLVVVDFLRSTIPPTYSGAITKADEAKEVNDSWLPSADQPGKNRSRSPLRSLRRFLRKLLPNVH